MDNILKYTLIGIPFLIALIIFIYGIKTGDPAYFTLGIGVIISTIMRLGDGVIDAGEGVAIFSSLLMGLKILKKRKKKKKRDKKKKIDTNVSESSSESSETVDIVSENRDEATKEDPQSI